MPTYVITGPDGNEYEVDAPEGASEADVLAYARSNYKAAPRATANPSRPEPRPDAAKGRGTLQFATPWKTYDSGIEMPEFLTQVLAGAGKAFSDTGRGVRQLVGKASQAEVDEARRLDADLMDTGGGLLGNIAGQFAQIALPGMGAVRGARALGAGRGLLPAAAVAEGAGFSALQPVATGDSRAGNAAWGGAAGLAGHGISSAAGRLANGIVQNPAAQQALEGARRAGVRLNTTQALDLPWLNTAASALDKLPFSGAAGAARAQRADFNRAVSRTFGEDAPAIDSDVYGAAKARIGQVFEDLSARNELPLAPELTGALRAIAQDSKSFATDDTARAVQSVLDEMVGRSANGILPGRAYQALDSKLGQLMKGGGEKAHYLGQVRDTVRDAMDNAISLGDQAAWQGARREWRNMKTVRDLVSERAGEGISPRGLRARVRANNAGKEAFASGRAGDLGDLAVLGQRIADTVPDSGTAQRLMTYAALGGAAGGAQAENPWISNASKAALTLAAGGLGARVLNSPGVARALVAERPVLQGVAQRIAPLTDRFPLARAAGGLAAVETGEGPPLEIDIVGGVPATLGEIAEQEAEAAQRRAEMLRLQRELAALQAAGY